MRLKQLRRGLAACAVVAAALVPGQLLAEGALTTKATNLETLKLSSGQPFPEKPYEIETGKYYRWVVEADGTAELAIAAPDLFRNIWINEVVINSIEVRPLGLDSIEFDEAGKVTISFVPIRPGTFEFYAPGNKALHGTFVVK
jgi:hypothetical protein